MGKGYKDYKRKSELESHPVELPTSEVYIFCAPPVFI